MTYDPLTDEDAVKLNAGWRYDLTTLGLAWSWTDGEYGDREVADWFDAAGRYLGPDSDGVEPLFLRSKIEGEG